MSAKKPPAKGANAKTAKPKKAVEVKAKSSRGRPYKRREVALPELVSKTPVGHPTNDDPVWKKEYVVQAQKLLALGATDRSLADFFGVSERCIRRWKVSHPEFGEAVMLSKEEYDAKVEYSLAARAIGYSHEATKIFCNAEGDVTEVKYTEHYPPDPTSMIFWLKNRKPSEWRDRVDMKFGLDPEDPIAKLLNAAAQSALNKMTPRLIGSDVAG